MLLAKLARSTPVEINPESNRLANNTGLRSLTIGTVRGEEGGE